MNHLLSTVFGILAGAAVLLVEILALTFQAGNLQTSSFPISLSWLLVLAFLEEGAKWLFLLRLSSYLPTASWLERGILFGLGFGSLEIALSSLSGTLSFLPLASVALLHVLTASLLAWAIHKGAARLQGGAYLMAVIIHFLFNAFRI